MGGIPDATAADYGRGESKTKVVVEEESQPRAHEYHQLRVGACSRAFTVASCWVSPVAVGTGVVWCVSEPERVVVCEGRGDQTGCVWVLKGERGVFWGKGCVEVWWKEQKKKEREMRK